MASKAKKKDISIFAFTLIELVIVLIIIGILLMSTLYLSGEQIQKVRDKTVKESISSEWLSHYSRNLGSSSFGEVWYKEMNILLEKGKNEINFEYVDKDEKNDKKITFTDKFEIKYIKTDTSKDDITITYQPYKINCNIGGDSNSVNLIISVNNHKDYCFEINNKNCRLLELSEPNCEQIKLKEGI